MLKYYNAVFDSYFQKHGNIRDCEDPAAFVLGLIALLEAAEKDFFPYHTYNELHKDFENRVCEIKYGLGRRTERLGVLNPSQYEKHIVANVKSGRLIKRLPQGKVPAFCYWFEGAHLIRSVAYGDPQGECFDKMVEDAYVQTEDNSSFCVVYSNGCNEKNVFESYGSVKFLFWENDKSSNTVRMFEAYHAIDAWELRYEETLFEEDVAVRLWNAEIHPYIEEIFLKIEEMFRDLPGKSNQNEQVIRNGHSFSMKEYDLLENT